MKTVSVIAICAVVIGAIFTSGCQQGQIAEPVIVSEPNAAAVKPAESAVKPVEPAATAQPPKEEVKAVETKAPEAARQEPNAVKQEAVKVEAKSAEEPAKKQELAAETKPAVSAETPKAPIDPNGIAATVNGVEIRNSQVDVMIKPQMDQLAMYASQMPPQVLEQQKAQLRQQGLEGIIVEHLLDEKVKANNIVVSEDEAIAKITELAAQQKMSLDDLKALLAAKGMSFDDVKNRIQRRFGYQKLMDAQCEGKVNVTEDDAKKYYAENQKQYEMPEEVKASHILISSSSDPNADPNQAKAKAKAKAEELLKQLKAGADFAELAKANSSCPSAEKGGDLGFLKRGEIEKTLKPFEDAAFSLKVGETSEPVETNYGYHIIKITDHKDPNTTSFEQVKSDITNRLTWQKKDEIARKYVEGLKAEAKVVYPAKDANSAPAKQ